MSYFSHSKTLKAAKFHVSLLDSDVDNLQPQLEYQDLVTEAWETGKKERHKERKRQEA